MNSTVASWERFVREHFGNKSRRTTSKKSAAIVAAAIASVTLLSGCDKFAEHYKDAPVKSRNETPAEVGNMPDGFSNWASKCDHGNWVYTLYHDDSSYGGISVVPNDPSCK